MLRALFQREPDWRTMRRQGRIAWSQMGASISPKTLTFLFTDIEGSTPLWDRQPDAMRWATERHNALLREAIAAHGGDTFRVVGDAFCVAFFDADSALLAAIDGQRALSAQPWNDAPIRVRMGLHSGAVELTGDEVFRGPALARAARVMSAAHGEQILVSAATTALLDARLPFGSWLRDLGDHTLRGFARPERLYQLVVPGLRAAFPPIHTREALRTNLPPALTSFIGRERALDDVRKRVRESRMVTLTGSGGTGKTRLMLETARELVDAFPDGVWLIELAALTVPAQMAQAIAAALGARAEGDVPALTLVADALGGKRSLLLLDNCEHLIDEAARIAQSLLRALPGLHILATSREALGVEGESVYRVQSLTLPAADANAVASMQSESICLFVERAQAVNPGFSVTARNIEAVTDICRRLDGIPLAIELAAARLNALSVEELGARLHDRFRVLAGGRRTALPRHRTLRALVDWSYDLLSDDERTVLMTLAVFAGGFTLEAAQSVCDNEALREASVLEAVLHLVDRSLLVAEHDPGTETRYRLLETIRQYAAEKLADARRADAARRRHFDYFLGLANRAEPELRKPAVLEWLDRIECDHDNLRAALDWADDAYAEGYARLAGALHEFWDVRGHFADGFERLERALALYAIEDPARLKAMLGAGVLAYRLDHRQHSATLLETAAALARRLSDTRREAEATLWRASALDSQGPDFIESEASKGRDLSCSIDDAWGIGFGTWQFGRVEALRGHPADSHRLFLESAAQFDRGGCVLMAAFARTWAGQVAIECLDFSGARALLENALADHHRYGNRHEAGTTLRSLGRLNLNLGRLDEALRECEESVDIFRSLHDPNCGSRSTRILAEVLLAKGEHAHALRLAQDAAAVAASLGFHDSRAGALWLAGRSHEAHGDPEAARDAYFEGLRNLLQSTYDTVLPQLLEAIAGGHPAASTAPVLLGAAAALREKRSAQVLPSERSDVDRWRAAVKRAHTATFEQDFTVGMAMARDEAIGLALALESVGR